MPKSRTKFLVLATLLALLQACAWGDHPDFSGGFSNDGPGRKPKNKEMRDAEPKWEQRTRAGNAPKYKVLGKTYYTLKTAEGYHRKGTASWYGRKFHGNNTANGEKYNMYAMTAAHKTLPIPSYARVKNLRNGREAIVRINDRGPFLHNREIDLSYAAAVKLGVFETGTAPVEVTGIEVTPKGKAIETRPQAHNPAPPTAPPVPPEPVAETIPLETPVAAAWWVQAGAFASRESANSLASRLDSQGFANRVLATDTLTLPYKVRIGPFALETHARWAQTTLAEKGFQQGFVIHPSAR